MDIFWQNLAVIVLVVGALTYMYRIMFRQKQMPSACKECQLDCTRGKCPLGNVTEKKTKPTL